MGNSCTKSQKKLKRCINRVAHPDISFPYKKSLQVGQFFAPDPLSRRNQKKLNKWSAIIQKHTGSLWPLDQCLKSPDLQQEFIKRIKDGPPSLYRWDAWKAIVGLNALTNHREFQSIHQAGVSTQIAIQKDLPRTFPFEPYFKEDGQRSLFIVLSKLAVRYPDLDYCQSLNFVAGFLLLVNGGNELETFYMMNALFDKYKMKGWYAKNMLGLKFSINRFMKVFERQFPRVSTHFVKQGIYPQMWVLQWFMTAFTIVFRPVVAVKIWDHLIVDGIQVLYKVSLAIIGSFQLQLLTLDTSGICQLMKNLGEIISDGDRLIKDSEKFFIELEDVEIDIGPPDSRHQRVVSATDVTFSFDDEGGDENSFQGKKRDHIERYISFINLMPL